MRKTKQNKTKKTPKQWSGGHWRKNGNKIGGRRNLLRLEEARDFK